MKEKRKFINPEAEIIELFDDIDTITVSDGAAGWDDGNQENI